MSAGVVSAAIRSVTQAAHHHRHSGGAVSSGTKHALLTFLRGTGQEDGRKERGQRANARGAMSIENELVTDFTAGCAAQARIRAKARATPAAGNMRLHNCCCADAAYTRNNSKFNQNSNHDVFRAAFVYALGRSSSITEVPSFLLR